MGNLLNLHFQIIYVFCAGNGRERFSTLRPWKSLRFLGYNCSLGVMHKLEGFPGSKWATRLLTIAQNYIFVILRWSKKSSSIRPKLKIFQFCSSEAKYVHILARSQKQRNIMVVYCLQLSQFKKIKYPHFFSISARRLKYGHIWVLKSKI